MFKYKEDLEIKHIYSCCIAVNDFVKTSWKEVEENNDIIINSGTKFLKNRKFVSWHNRVCQEKNNDVKIFFGLYNLRLKKNIKYILYFEQWFPAIQNKAYFIWLKSNYNVKLVLMIANPIINKRYPLLQGVNIEDLRDYFDLIITDEKMDANLYNIVYAPDVLSNFYLENQELKWDLFFAGSDKGRLDLIYQVMKSSKKNEVKANIMVVNTPFLCKHIQSIKEIPYSQIIENDLKANCILEILQPGQESYTTRMQEAVILKKKLLTNNKNVTSEKFYDPKYVQVFENPEHIDWEFVKKREKVSYEYQDEFSPYSFMSFIEKKLNEKDSESRRD